MDNLFRRLLSATVLLIGLCLFVSPVYSERAVPPKDASELHQAAAAGNREQIRTLIKKSNSRFFARDSKNRLPIYYSSINGHYKESRLLLRKSLRKISILYSKEPESTELFQEFGNKYEYTLALRERIANQLKWYLTSTKFDIALEGLKSLSQHEDFKITGASPQHEVRASSAQVFIQLGNLRILLTHRHPMVIVSISGPNDYHRYGAPKLLWFGEEVRRFVLKSGVRQRYHPWNVDIYRYENQVFRIIGWIRPTGSGAFSDISLWEFDGEQVEQLKEIGMKGSVINYDSEKRTVYTSEARSRLTQRTYLKNCKPVYKADKTLKEIESNCCFIDFPLHATATSGGYRKAKKLINHGFKVNKQTEQGETPLHRAVCGVKEKMIEVLIKHDADPTLTDQNGRTPLHLIANEKFCAFSLNRSDTQGFRRVINLLLKNGTNLNHQDKEGKTPLHYVVEANKAEIAKFLMKKGAKPTISDKNGKTARELALESENKKLIRLFKKQ